MHLGQHAGEGGARMVPVSLKAGAVGDPAAGGGGQHREGMLVATAAGGVGVVMPVWDGGAAARLSTLMVRSIAIHTLYRHSHRPQAVAVPTHLALHYPHLPRTCRSLSLWRFVTLRGSTPGLSGGGMQKSAGVNCVGHHINMCELCGQPSMRKRCRRHVMNLVVQSVSYCAGHWVEAPCTAGP